MLAVEALFLGLPAASLEGSCPGLRCSGIFASGAELFVYITTMSYINSRSEGDQG
jgi:hypothetical protein